MPTAFELILHWTHSAAAALAATRRHCVCARGVHGLCAGYARLAALSRLCPARTPHTELTSLLLPATAGSTTAFFFVLKKRHVIAMAAAVDFKREAQAAVLRIGRDILAANASHAKRCSGRHTWTAAVAELGRRARPQAPANTQAVQCSEAGGACHSSRVGTAAKQPLSPRHAEAVARYFEEDYVVIRRLSDCCCGTDQCREALRVILLEDPNAAARQARL